MSASCGTKFASTYLAVRIPPGVIPNLEWYRRRRVATVAHQPYRIEKRIGQKYCVVTAKFPTEMITFGESDPAYIDCMRLANNVMDRGFDVVVMTTKGAMEGDINTSF